MTALPPAPLTDDTASAGSRLLRRRVVVVSGLVVAALATVYLGLAAASGDGLPRGAHVLDVEVGGMSEAEAVRVLEQQLGPRADAAITATVGPDHVSVVPADSGLSFDAAATVQGVSGRIWNPITLVTQFTGGPSIDPVVVVDQAALDAAVTSIAADVDDTPVEPAITFEGTTPSLTPGTTGTVLDRAASTELLRDAYLVSSEPVTLPIVEAEPTVGEDAAAAALDAAKVAVSAPVTVTASGITTSIPETALAEAMSFEAVDGALTPKLDGEVLRAAIADDIASVESPGRDARWKVSSGKPVIVPSKVGKGVNAEQLAEDVAGVLASTSESERAIVARIGTIEPTLTTEKAESLGVVEKLSSFTQYFPYAAYRVQNIGQAAKYIDNTLLMPGETFSLNKTIKERTPANGYTVGFVVGPGGVFAEDLGGGVSTSATTTWTAAFYAGLERVYTQAHSIWISRYRAGLEATVAWGSFDMKFRNDTPNAVLITTDMRNTSLTVAIWGTKVYDKIKAESGARYNVRPYDTIYNTSKDCHAQSGSPGFAIDVYRVFVKDGAEVKREKITTRYRPSPIVRCGPDPADKPSPSPSPSGSGSAKPSGSATPSPSG